MTVKPSKCFYGFVRLRKGSTPHFYQKKLLYGSPFKQEGFKNLLSLYLSDKISSWVILSSLRVWSPKDVYFDFFFFFFWQSLISLGDAAELYNFGQRQMCDDSVTWQWGQGSGGFKNECGCMLWVTKTSLWVQRGVADDSMWPRCPISCAWCFLPPALVRSTPWGAQPRDWSQGGCWCRRFP